MPVKELQMALQGCPQCQEIVKMVAQNPQETVSALGGVAGTLALIIQTSNDLHEVIQKLRGDHGGAKEVTINIERNCEMEGHSHDRLSVSEALEMEGASEEELHKELETNVQKLLSHNLEDFQCTCTDCDAPQKSLSEFA